MPHTTGEKSYRYIFSFRFLLLFVGMSGIIFSHSYYGRTPYNASRNCFMMIVAPAGYRIRLRAIEFDVNGHISNCDKDTLHVFDHESPLDMSQPLRNSLDDVSSPGPIIGESYFLLQSMFFPRTVLWQCFEQE